MNDSHGTPSAPRWKGLLERLAGAVLLAAGAWILQAGELNTRRLHFSGTMAYVAGATVVLLGFLLLRGRIYSTDKGRDWTRVDAAAGVLMALGFAACVAVRLYQSFTGTR